MSIKKRIADWFRKSGTKHNHPPSAYLFPRLKNMPSLGVEYVNKEIIGTEIIDSLNPLDAFIEDSKHPFSKILRNVGSC